MNKVLAQLRNPVLPDLLGGGSSPRVESGSVAIGKLIGALIGAILTFSFILAFIYLIMGGLSWVTSAGDKSKLETARNKITHALVGLIIVASTWAVMKLVGQFLGLNMPDLKLPSVGN